jgi:uncharacterized protein (TIGR02246 family)
VDDLDEIKKLKARYFRCLDTKDWDGYRQVFTDDVVVDLSVAGGEVWRGRDAFMDYARSLTIVQSVHHGHMPEIDFTSSTTATGIWSMEDHVRWVDGNDTHGYGHYHETYEKVDGHWRIKTMQLSYLRMDVTSSRVSRDIVESSSLNTTRA